jgi:hypothetical protein
MLPRRLINGIATALPGIDGIKARSELYCEFFAAQTESDPKRTKRNVFSEWKCIDKTFHFNVPFWGKDAAP